MENFTFIPKLNCQIGKAAGSRSHLGGAQEASRGAESYVGATRIAGTEIAVITTVHLNLPGFALIYQSPLSYLIFVLISTLADFKA